MSYHFKKHIVYPPLLLFFLVAFCGLAQTQQDTLQLIQKFHLNGRNFVKIHDYENAIVDLSKAYKMAASPTFRNQRLDIQFSIAQLHYLLQNYGLLAKNYAYQLALPCSICNV